MPSRNAKRLYTNVFTEFIRFTISARLSNLSLTVITINRSTRDERDERELLFSVDKLSIRIPSATSASNLLLTWSAAI
jgi:hypothetical protein